MEMIRKTSLSRTEQQLIELMQEINFGQIKDLEIHAGLPVMTPRPRAIFGIKIGGDNGRRPEYKGGDYLLRTEVTELLNHLKRIQNGMVHELVIKHGLPFSLDVEAFVARCE